MSFVQ